MTFLMRRRMVAALIVVPLATILLLGITAWWAVTLAGETDPAGIKVMAERLLLAGFLAAALVGLTAAFVLRDAVNVHAALVRLTELNRRGPSSTKRALHRLGEVGTLILGLLHETERLSAQKTTRISAMSALLGVLVVRSPRKFLVVNPAGRVYRASPPALESLEKALSEVIDKPVDAILPGEPFAHTLAALERSPEIHTLKAGASEITVLPVPNDQGQTAYYFYDLEGRKETALQEFLESLRQPERPAPGTPGHTGDSTAPALAGGLQRFFSRKNVRPPTRPGADQK
ncbi:hypothetical protein SAMN05920897_11722 [Alkalispirochaeta americana]|uniref:Uncharacterized protein n=1 Tax=Alkalispirochaeta americana TaxID=159291 RepID=A0A1N6WD68_9SPIO|nr:hypothetical protein [Alkalispirochaeta americana]SIQ87895.1 hypothetical protein SAMN05920897_11722 [Alkalispirochaeta americana]